MPSPVNPPGAPARADAKDARRKVRLPGTDSFLDVATKVYKDPRVVPLLMDLNPDVPGTGPIPKGTVITLPAMGEVKRFASKMGFTLGFDPAAGGATKAKRAWSKMQDGAKVSRSVDPVQLASVLAGQQLPPEDAAKRLLALVVGPELDAFLAATHDDPAVDAIAKAAEHHLLKRTVREAMSALADVLEGTRTPEGRRKLFEAFVADAEDTDRLLASLLVAPALKRDLALHAPRVVDVLSRAEALAKEDPHVQDARLQRTSDEERPVLKALVEAAADRVKLLEGERLSLLGVDKMVAALDGHAGQLAGTLKKLQETLDRAPIDVLRAVADGESAAQIPRPWPVVAALIARLGDDLSNLHAGRRALGAGALVGKANQGPAPHETSVSAGPRMSAAELAAKAAANARIADEHDGVPERLTATLVALFDPLRPSTPDRGPEAQVRERRKMRFEKAVLGARGCEGDPGVMRSVVAEVLDLARRSDALQVRRRAERLPAGVKQGALQLCEQATGNMPVLLRGASDVGRALLIAALALDAEIGPTLARESGREAAAAFLKRHAGPTLSLATKAYVEAGKGG